MAHAHLSNIDIV